MLPKLCHLDNDLEIIIIIYSMSIHTLRSTHDLNKPYSTWGHFFFSWYPSVALARNNDDQIIIEVAQQK